MKSGSAVWRVGVLPLDNNGRLGTIGTFGKKEIAVPLSLMHLRHQVVDLRAPVELQQFDPKHGRFYQCVVFVGSGTLVVATRYEIHQVPIR